MATEQDRFLTASLSKYIYQQALIGATGSLIQEAQILSMAARRYRLTVRNTFLFTPQRIEAHDPLHTAIYFAAEMLNGEFDGFVYYESEPDP